MAIDPNERPTTDEADKEVLRRVYADQLRDLRPRLEAAKEQREQAARALGAADEAHSKAVHEAAWLQGQVDSIVLLAKRDGINLNE